MSLKDDRLGGEPMDQSWMGGMVIRVIILAIAFAAIMSWVVSCGVCKPNTEKETVIEYRDREVHDTTTLEIQKEVEKIVTKDTISHLENKYGKSDAVVSGGLLHHSLETKPQIIKVPFTVTVTDTLWKESEIKEIVKEVEKPMSWWRKFQIGAFWCFLGCLIGAIVFALRKLIF